MANYATAHNATLLSDSSSVDYTALYQEQSLNCAAAATPSA